MDIDKVVSALKKFLQAQYKVEIPAWSDIYMAGGRQRILIFGGDHATAILVDKRLLGLQKFVTCTNEDVLTNLGIKIAVPTIWEQLQGQNTVLSFGDYSFRLSASRNTSNGFRWMLKADIPSS